MVFAKSYQPGQLGGRAVHVLSLASRTPASCLRCLPVAADQVADQPPLTSKNLIIPFCFFRLRFPALGVLTTSRRFSNSATESSLIKYLGRPPCRHCRHPSHEGSWRCLVKSSPNGLEATIPLCGFGEPRKPSGELLFAGRPGFTARLFTCGRSPGNHPAIFYGIQLPPTVWGDDGIISVRVLVDYRQT
jgi:hypothetical protein